MAAVSVRNAAVAFGQLTVFDDVSLDFEEGEFVVLLGPSGCGKSTLLNAIAGLLDIDRGQIFIGGRNVTWEEPKDRGIAMVFQSYALYPRMTVRQNMSFGLKMAKTPRAEIERRVDRAAEMLQITHLLKRRPDQLSGGQRQRVAIGRALVRDADVFLFDEPLSNLDAQLRNELRLEIKRLHMQLGSTTMIYVTHDQIEAMTLADRIVVMKDKRIQQVGTPAELYHQPANLFVAGFVGSPRMNFVDGFVVAGDGAPVFDGGDVRLPFPQPADVAVGTAVTLGIRPEHIAVGEGAGVWRGFTAQIVEPLGADNLVWAGNGETLLQMRLPGDQPVGLGEPISLVPDAARAAWFDTRTGVALASADPSG